MYIKNKNYIFVSLALVLIFFVCCTANTATHELIEFTSYRDLPDITQAEIQAIEQIRLNTPQFVYGALLNTEAFSGANGEIRGFSALFTEWLSEFFDIPFVLQHFTWGEMINGLNDGSIDFIGNFTPTEERRNTYFMTETPIAMRTLKYIRLRDSDSIESILQYRPLRLAFLDGVAAIGIVETYAVKDYEIILVPEYIDAYDLLVSREIDALVAENTVEYIFHEFENIVVEDFLPTIYNPICFTTGNEEFSIIIDLVQRAMDNSHSLFLANMYDEGYQEYILNKFQKWLTDEEREFIENNSVIYIGAEFDNYPNSYFDRRYNEWRGIAIDVLQEVGRIAGVQFKIVNEPDKDFSVLLEMLSRGEIALVTEVVQTPQREGTYLWPQTSIYDDSYVIISKTDYPNLKISQAHSSRIGVSSSTAYKEFFLTNFPNHENFVIFPNQELLFEALENNEIDMVLSSYSSLLYLLNYQEQPYYKPNIIFDEGFTVTPGFNLKQETLVSVYDKALEYIDTELISDQWIRRAYDYRAKIAEAQRPMFMIAYVLCIIIVAFAIIFSYRNFQKRLEFASLSHWYKAILDAIPLPIAVMDNHMTVTYANNETGNFLQNDDYKKLIGKHCSVFKLGICNSAYCETGCIRLGINDLYFVKNSLHYQINFEKIYDAKGQLIGHVDIVQDITKHMLLSNYEYAHKLSDALARMTKSPIVSTEDLEGNTRLILKEGCRAINATRISAWIIELDESGIPTVIKPIVSYETEIDGFYKPEEIKLDSCITYVQRLIKNRFVAIDQISSSDYRGEFIGTVHDNVISILDAPSSVDNKHIALISIEQDALDRHMTQREWTIEETNFASSLADLLALAISTAERKAALEAAEAANKSKSSFLATMSHEIRTPLNAILGITVILATQQNTNNQVTEGLEKIYNSCNLLLSIINDILDFSKIEAGKLDIIPKEYCVASMINDTVNLNMMRIGDKPIKFELDTNENIPVRLIGDELRIKQVLNNILTNAFKYTDEGKVTLTATSEPIDDEQIYFIFSVQDTGSGMTKEQVEKIFDEYTRFNRENNTIEGTGLGMAITQSLLRLMNGEISVESEVGKGSLFTVKIPQKTAGAGVFGEELAESLRNLRFDFMESHKKIHIMREQMPYGKVLIVDDVETNLYVASGLMNPYGLNIETVTSGFAAIEKIKSGKEYDVIFLDHMMPEMDGIQTKEKLRNMGYTKPIVAFTANAVIGQAEMFLQNGFDGFISKPIDIRELDMMLNKFVRNAHPPSKREPMPYGSVLVVDDVETNLYVAAGLMAPYGLKIDKAKSGFDAIEAIESGKEYDVIFLDHKMPKMDGIQTNKKLREMGYKKPIIALTASVEADQEEVFLQSGFDGFVSKPIELDTLDGILNKYVRDVHVPKKIQPVTQNISSDVMLINSFIRDTHKILPVLENFNKDPETLRAYTVSIHGIKSALNSIGERALSEEAKNLENAARENNFKYIEEKNILFTEQLKVILAHLQKNEKPTITKEPDFLGEKLQELKNACGEYDRKAALDIINELTPLVTKETQNKLMQIEEFVITSDFEEAEALLEGN